jgi:serine/threonine protein kinase
MGNGKSKGIPQHNPNAQHNNGNSNNSNNSSNNNNGAHNVDGMIFSSDEKGVTFDDFEILKLIGKGRCIFITIQSSVINHHVGNFAKVLQVRKKDSGKIYAMKVLNKKKLEQSDQLEHIKTERTVLQYVYHPFLVRLLYAFQTPEKLFMVMDFVNGGELFFHLKKDRRFPEHRVKFYSAELLLALSHLHEQNVVFRDLKPENVLMDKDGNIMLTDFGLAKFLSRTDRTHTFCGTPEYLAPEVLLQKGHGKPVDWWSYGTLIFEMLVGIPPFYSENVQEMYDKILNSDLILPEQLMSTEAMDLLTRLLERDPKKRLGSGPTEWQEIKNHPFFDGIDWEQLYNKSIKPPFIPNVKGELDTSFFDEEFTRQNPNDSDDEDYHMEVGSSVQKEFEGFTYEGDSHLDKIDKIIEED